MSDCKRLPSPPLEKRAPAMIKKTPSTPYSPKASDDLSTHLSPILERLTEKIDFQLSEYLRQIGIKKTTNDLWSEYSADWQSKRLILDAHFLELSHQLARGAKGAANPESIAEMVFAAVAAAHYSEDFIDAFDWLGRAQQAVGYGMGMLHARGSGDHSLSSKEGRPEIAKRKADVLAFLELHQPASGWSRNEAIKAYSAQDVKQASAVVQSMSADYWADIKSKLFDWLERDSEFSEAFMKRIKAQPKAAWLNPLI